MESTFCPKCKIYLTLPASIENIQWIMCPSCKHSFENPTIKKAALLNNINWINFNKLIIMRNIITTALLLIFITSCNKLHIEENTGIESVETTKNKNDLTKSDSIEKHKREEEIYSMYILYIQKFGTKKTNDIMFQNFLKVGLSQQIATGYLNNLYERYEEENKKNDFEYSEHWRKDAYFNTKEYLIELFGKYKKFCKLIGQGYYKNSSVEYLGNRGYLVKVLCEFDCKQKYNHQKYIWVYAYYLGNNRWSLDIDKETLIE